MNLTIEQVAQICHETNRLYCKTARRTAQPAWGKCTADVQESMRAGVVNALRHPGITPEEQHEAWVDWKTTNGWTPGGVVDYAAKVHNCLVPWDQLTPFDRAKDVLFLSIVQSLGTLVDPNEYRPRAPKKGSR